LPLCLFTIDFFHGFSAVGRTGGIATEDAQFAQLALLYTFEKVVLLWMSRREEENSGDDGEGT
jgi:hypothetical protein